MKKILTGIVCGLLVFSVLTTGALGAKHKKVKPKPKRIVHEPLEQRRETPVIIREAPPVLQPGPAYTKSTSFGGQIIGFSAGLFGGIPSVAAEIWFPNILDTAKLNLRSGVRYAQGEERKNALVFLDGIYFFYDRTRVRAYLGGGLNCLAYTTGKTSGSVGGELYLGMEAGSWHSGSFYLEAGYAVIRTGFSPSIKGLNLNIGYKTGM
ncbi:MAG: hypothetical protein PHH14_02860 [Candidatus Margulisbacteria bacterium]|nr:hypothetical protein [Candidatus Margulisiibacteriota bacterium]